MRQPEIVSRVINGGSGGFIGILCDDPTRVLKFCSPDNQDAVECLQREREILSALGQHEHIARLHAVLDLGVNFGLCFEYYPFGSLRDYYKTLDGKLPPPENRFHWCHQCVSAISYIHSKNILHNDLSTRNILLSTDMNIKICDFGFSTFPESISLGRAETRYGPPTPPQVETALPASDLFAIGSLFFEILSGERPFDDVDSASVERRYENHNFPSLENIDPNYAKIIDDCWNGRYVCIRDVEQQLIPLSFSTYSYE